MKKTALKTLSLAAAIGCLALVSSGVSWAQTTNVYQVNYFANNNIAAAPDETVRVDNSGMNYKNLCSMIYVFDNDQQMTECCGCNNTPNGLHTMSVKLNLTHNPLTGVVSNNGVIKIVSAALNASPCNPSVPYTPTPNLHIWGTHVQAISSTTYAVTETNFQPSTLGATELSNLQSQCAFIKILGSGSGLCTCGTGD